MSVREPAFRAFSSDFTRGTKWYALVRFFKIRASFPHGFKYSWTLTATTRSDQRSHMPDRAIAIAGVPPIALVPVQVNAALITHGTFPALSNEREPARAPA
jgi:hypothetical protein